MSEFTSESSTRTEFTVQGIPVSAIAAEHGTPCYVYDGAELAARMRAVRTALYPGLEVFYSLKANPNISICALLHENGARAEVSSLAELHTALRAGVAPEDILFLGPGKSEAELRACLETGIHAIICESFGELDRISALAAESGVTARVVLRVNPDFAVKGSGLTMGGKPRQFGIDAAQLFEAEPLTRAHVRLIGVQVYMGTRILAEEPIAENTRRILDLAQRLARHHRFELELVDIGGGLGVAYFEKETDLDLDVLAGLLNPLLEKFAADHPGTRLVMELGRYLTATAGLYVTRVEYVKTSNGERFAVTDGGTNHHMAAVGIGSFVKRNFPMRVLGAAEDAATEPWNVTGPLCTPNDTIGKKVALPAVEPGDLIGVLRSGAYGPSASPVHFLSHGHPAEVLVHEGRAHLIREADGVEDLLGKQRLLIDKTH
ncbi:diaminopimelate decarboxylase [Sciscionella sediminilitoris]|uniref:diaminopimelate decarboxylase n=1 Tax=Sciscionella sediminilitoris TaxID=1445613 RepID=UPI00068B35C4|nr:diaminopimelate decarboxylase [Sciscionella sp. SE31]